MLEITKDTNQVETPRIDTPDSLAQLIADASRAVRRSLHMRLASYGVRGGSWNVLKALYALDGTTQRELAQSLRLSEPSVLEMLRAMEADGLITRTRDTADRRKMRVYLTDHARSLRQPLSDIAADMNNIMTADFSAAESIVLRLLMHRIKTTMETDHREQLRKLGEAAPLDDKFY